MIIPGTEITCPKCRMLIAKTNCIIETDEDDGSIYWDDFDFVTPAYENHVKTEGTNCPACETAWSDSGGWIHTIYGWEEVN